MNGAMKLNRESDVLVGIIEMFAALVVTIRESFIHQHIGSLDGIDKQFLDLNEEIAFDAVMADEVMIGKALNDREPLIHYRNVLTHLQMVEKSLKLLTEMLRRQMEESVLLSEKEVRQIVRLLDYQGKILEALAGIVRNGDTERLKEVHGECREVVESCLEMATSYESRLVEGLCTPESARILLAILGRIQSLAHDEVETVGLLARWIWDHAAGVRKESLA